jgi:predicted RNA-binding Zn-ribbon protein involved in translation (DUF1610 family)
MPIKFSCPACGKQTQAPDEMAGKQARCPMCKEVIDVPAPVFDPDATAAPYKVADVPATKGEDEGRKPCPMCGEMILQDAAKCRFCGEIFDPELRKSQKKVNPGDSDMSTGEYVLAFVCSGIGCIMGVIYMIQGKPKGLKMFLISLGMSVVWTLIRVALEAGHGR